MATTERGRAYGYRNAQPSHSQSYLSAPLDNIIARQTWPSNAKALDYGCGNGWFANWLAGRGFKATGVDISPSGIEVAQRNFPEVAFSTDVSAESLARLGPFQLATCIEVIAHCYRPAEELARIHASLAPGGYLILSTPYHGYWKYLALAVAGRMENYLDTAWDGAYMHHFSARTMTKLLEEAGFRDIEITRAGRIPPLAKAMIVRCRKPPL
jgi:2-polyprenyl-6-hydroxyphenyl methylase/3-demethylubiquinone-9 3-methyltransferase